MNRRTHLALLAATVLIGTAAAAGCADEPPGGATGSGSGTVFTAVGPHAINENGPINPHNAEGNSFVGYNAMQLAWVKNSVVETEDQFLPGLAAEWDIAPDQTTVTVRLQPDAKWSDGSPVTADDVRTSAAVAFTQGSGAFATTPGTQGGLGSVAVTGEREIVFKQAPGSANNTFARNVLSLIIVPDSVFGPQLPDDFWDILETATAEDASEEEQTAAQETIAELGEKIVAYGPGEDVSAGPFVLSHVTPDQAVLNKNEHYFNADEIGPDQVVLKNYSGNQDIWNMLIAREIDAAPFTSTPKNVVDEILSKEGNEMRSGFSPVSVALTFNHSVEPFGELPVRRALAYAIDRTEVTQVASPVAGTPSEYTTGMVAAAEEEWLGDEVAKLDPYERDLDKAAAELEAAGFTRNGNEWYLPNGDRFAFTLRAPAGFDDWIKAAQTIERQLTEFGIAVKTTTVADYPTYLEELDAGKYEVAFWLVALGPSTYNTYQRFYGPQNGWSPFGGRLTYTPPGEGSNWIGGHETATIDGHGVLNPGELTYELSQVGIEEQREIVGKLAAYTNQELPGIQLWDYVNIQFINTSRFTDFPEDDSELLRLNAGVWMQLGHFKPVEK